MKPQVLKSLSVAAALTLALSACGSSEPEAAEGEPELLSAGKLTVCTDAPYKPFEYPDKSSPTGYTGFDMEIVDAIAAGDGPRGRRSRTPASTDSRAARRSRPGSATWSRAR